MKHVQLQERWVKYQKEWTRYIVLGTEGTS